MAIRSRGFRRALLETIVLSVLTLVGAGAFAPPSRAESPGSLAHPGTSAPGSSATPDESVNPGAPRHPADVVDLNSVGGAELLGKTEAGLVPLPIVDTKVELTITGVMVHGVIRQEFVNPDSRPLEALYVFPLPARAAVHAMEMQIGDRRIVATVKEREEAKAAYETAKKEGKKASLVQQQRPNLFTTAVTGINPGETVVVQLEFLQESDWRDGEFSTVFPLTYTPRYVPCRGRRSPESPPTGEGDSSVSDKGGRESGQVDTLSPSVMDGVFAQGRELRRPEASIRVRFEGAFQPARVASPSHDFHESRIGEVTTLFVGRGRSASELEMDGPTVLGRTSGDAGRSAPTERASLAEDAPSDPPEALERIPADRDFVLHWRPRREHAPTASLFVENREDGRYGLLMILPPVPESDAATGLPTDTIFVVDTSGSMDGPSIVQARQALLEALANLRPGDGFNIIRFSSDHEAFHSEMSRAPDAVEGASRWVRSLRASGGTEIVPAVVAALQMVASTDPGRARRVILLTDGAVGNEEEAFAAVTPLLGDTRLHLVGIGPAPNAFLMEKLARFGRGAVEFIHGPEEVKDKMEAFLRRVDRPVLTNLAIDWRGAPPLETYPEKLPDLYAGDPLFLSLRLGVGHPGTAGELVGRTRGGELRVPVEVGENGIAESGIAVRWARAKVESLMDAARDGGNPLAARPEVIALAKAFTLVTPWTSLIAVEERPSVEGAGAMRLVPNALPVGSRLCDGVLPQGGTEEPLATRLGFVLFGAGSVVLLALRIGRRR